MRLINMVIALAVSVCCVASARPVATSTHKAGKVSRGTIPIGVLGTTSQSVKNQDSVKMQQKFNPESQNFLESLKKNNVDPVEQIILRVKNNNQSVDSMSRKKSKEVAQYLVTKAQVANVSVARVTNNVVKSMRKHPSVAQAVKQLHSHVMTGKSHLKPHYLALVLQFVGSLKTINPLALSAESVTAESVVLNLGTHVGEIASSKWSKEQRANALSLIAHYTKYYSGNKSPENAMNQALKDRGYNTVAEQISRLKDIKENCRKG